MTLASLVAYSCALFIAAAIPGPGMTALVARALGSGARETAFMGLGLVLGDMTYLTAVILGLAFVAQAFASIFLVIKFLGVAYLVYIAWKLWTAGLIGQEVVANRARGSLSAFVSGYLVTLGNPKVMLFYIALVPTLIDMQAIGAFEYAVLLVTTFVVLVSVLVPYIALATRARTLLRKPSALKVLNRTAAGILASTAAFIAARQA